MDKLKKALTGRDNEGDEEKGFVAQVQLDLFIKSIKKTSLAICSPQS